MAFFHEQSSVYAKVITPSDTVDNLRNAKWIQNTGTAGVFTVRQNIVGGKPGTAPTLNPTVVVGLGVYQKESVPMSWLGVNATGLGAGVVLVAYF